MRLPIINTGITQSDILLPLPLSGLVDIQPKKPHLLFPRIPYETQEITNTITNPLKSAVGSLNFWLPNILPQTGTPLWQLRERWVDVIKNKNVQTEMYDRIIPVSPRVYKYKTDLSYWLERLPKSWWYQHDRNASNYLVIPRLWIITPITSIPESTKDYKNSLYWKPIDINNRLQWWVLHYPLSGLPASIGNMVIVGHSSYFKNDQWRYKTIFTSLPLLNQDDEIWVYQKTTNKGDNYWSVQDRSWSWYNRYIYRYT